MSRHNYSQYSNKNNKPKNDEIKIPVSNQGNAAVVEETVTPTAEMTTTVAAPATTMEIKMESAPAPKTVSGVVANCTKLNIREKADISSDVVCVLDAASAITIDVSKSTTEWFKVYTATGVEGYCMRKFVDTRP